MARVIEPRHASGRLHTRKHTEIPARRALKLLKYSRLSQPSDTRRFVAPTFFYAALVVYGSLLPFAYAPRDFSEALSAFRALQLLDLGMLDRADWIANGVLFAPLGALIYASFAGTRASLICALGAFVLSGLIAVALEFAQLYFPPRTVSLNDLVSEAIGSVAGIVLWMAAAPRTVRVISTLRAGGQGMLRAVLLLYALLYLGLSFFPYDFVVSLREFTAVNGARPAWFSLAQYCSGSFDCARRGAVEIVASAPIGMLLASILNRAWRPRLLVAALAGALLGAVIEFGQAFLVTGNPHAVSVGTRATGFAIGAGIWQALVSGVLSGLYRRRRLLVVLALGPYLLTLAYANKWFTGSPATPGTVGAILDKLNFTPFYYHYYSSEAVALTSTLLYFALYFPLGAMWSLWRGSRPCHALCVGVVALAAALLAVVMEAGKLWFASLPPDPSDVVIAAIAAALGVWLTSRILAPASERPEVAPLPRGDAHPFRPLALIAALGAMVFLIRYPYAQTMLFVAGAAYVLLLLRFTHAWLAVVPMTLAWPDLAEFSGWFFFDEADFILLLTIAVSYWRYCPPQHAARFKGALPFAFLAVSYLASIVIGLLPFAPLDAAAFSDYRSPYNALRIGKAMFWALLLVPLLRAAFSERVQVKQWFAFGMSLGLLFVGLAAVEERLLFAGLFDFQSDFRITVLSSMHIGSGILEAYLILAVPFAVYLVKRGERALLQIAGGLAALLGVYALIVTFSRGAQLALIVGAGVMLMGYLLRAPKSMRTALSLALLLSIVFGAVASAPFMQKRYADSSSDFLRRLAHWKTTVQLASDAWYTGLLGHGVGAFPRIWAYANSDALLPANYRFMSEAGNGFLRLGPGEAFYIEQRVSVKPGVYKLEFDARSMAENALLATPLCEKTVLYSRDCAWDQTGLTRPPGTWQRYGNGIDIGALGQTRFGQRPTKFALHLARAEAPVDIDNVRLIDARGNNAIVNGDFERGSARWLFTVDNYWPWHVENMFVHMWFEQGWVGVVALLLWLTWAIAELLTRVRAGEQFSLAALAGICGFLIVGLFSSLLDAPRLMLLLFLAVMIGAGFRWREKPLRH